MTEAAKRGRPKSHARRLLESMPPSLKPEGCFRTQMNESYVSLFVGEIDDAAEHEQLAIFENTTSEIRAGHVTFPIGFRGAAVEVGRYMDGCCEDWQGIVAAVAAARQNGVSWRDIGAHYRALRLGERKGNEQSLSVVIARAVDEYRKNFPKTSNEQIREALAKVYAAAMEDT